MTTLQQIITALKLTVLSAPSDLERITPTGGYCSDLLSCVMAGAAHGNLWVTLQAHNNIIAVAALRDLSASLITEDAQPDAATIAKANEEGICLLSTPLASYEVVGHLWGLGIQ
jgi:hypothetical protein